jgi:hypothetical protein
MAIVGIFTIVILEPFDDIPHVKFFRKWFPLVLLVLFIGFYVELIRQIIIDGFGLTASLYLYSSLWVVGNSLFLITKPKWFKFSIGQQAMWSLTDIIFLITAFPFLNVYSIERYHLNSQLETVLTELNMLENGVIIPRADLTNDQENDLINLVNDCSEIGFNRINLIADDFTMLDFSTVFGFEANYHFEDDNIVYINYGIYTPGTDLSTLLSHEVLLDIRGLRTESSSIGDYDYIYRSTDLVWELSALDVVILELDMKTAVLDIYEALGAEEAPVFTDLHFAGINADISYDVYFQSIYAQYDSTAAEFLSIGATFYIGFTFLI